MLETIPTVAAVVNGYNERQRFYGAECGSRAASRSLMRAVRSNGRLGIGAKVNRQLSDVARRFVAGRRGCLVVARGSAKRPVTYLWTGVQRPLERRVRLHAYALRE